MPELSHTHAHIVAKSSIIHQTSKLTCLFTQPGINKLHVISLELAQAQKVLEIGGL